MRRTGCCLLSPKVCPFAQSPKAGPKGEHRALGTQKGPVGEQGRCISQEYCTLQFTRHGVLPFSGHFPAQNPPGTLLLSWNEIRTLRSGLPPLTPASYLPTPYSPPSRHASLLSVLKSQVYSHHLRCYFCLECSPPFFQQLAVCHSLILPGKSPFLGGLPWLLPEVVFSQIPSTLSFGALDPRSPCVFVCLSSVSSVRQGPCPPGHCCVPRARAGPGAWKFLWPPC